MGSEDVCGVTLSQAEPRRSADNSIRCSRILMGQLSPPADLAPYNNWTISRYCWETLRRVVQPGWTTLECGSGLSTLLFEAAGCRHTALEHDPNRCAASQSVVLAGLAGTPRWYDWSPATRFDLIFVDGPPGRIGRAGICGRLGELMHERTILVIDDTNRLAEFRLSREIARDFSLDGYGFPGFGRSFTILGPRNCVGEVIEKLTDLPMVGLDTRPRPIR